MSRKASPSPLTPYPGAHAESKFLSVIPLRCGIERDTLCRLVLLRPPPGHLQSPLQILRANWGATEVQ